MAKRMPKDPTILNTKKPINAVAVVPCSMCEKIAITVGDIRRGGIRFCEECLKHTFGWFQMAPEQRESIGARFRAAADDPLNQTLLEAAGKMDAELLKAISIGEARLRCLDADMRETRGY